MVVRDSKETTDGVADKVVALRSAGKSFTTIAKAVGLKRSVDAFGVFVEAVRSRPSDEQDQLRADENRRLDVLERRTRERSEADELDRKLENIKQLRERLAK